MHAIVESNAYPRDNLTTPGPTKPSKGDVFNRRYSMENHQQGKNKILEKNDAVEERAADKGRLVPCLLIFPEGGVVVVVVAVDAGEGVQEKAQEVFLVKGRPRCVQDKVEDQHDSGMSIV